MLIEPNFSDVKDPIVEGTYSARIVNAAVAEWPSGDKYVNWTLETFGETDPKNNGRRIYHRTPIAGGAAFKLQDLHVAALGTAAAGPFEAEALYGKEVKVVVVDGMNKHGEPTGYPEVKKVGRL